MAFLGGNDYELSQSTNFMSLQMYAIYGDYSMSTLPIYAVYFQMKSTATDQIIQ